MSAPDRHPHASGRSLSPREREILAAVAAGERTRDIAARLGLSDNTVKSHLTRLYKKLAVRNRVEAARYYLNLDATSDGPPAPAADQIRVAFRRAHPTLIDQQIQELERRLAEIHRLTAEADELKRALLALKAVRGAPPG